MRSVSATPPPRTPAPQTREGPLDPDGRREAEFTRLSRRIVRCTRCPLAQSRTHAVVYRGSLSPRVVFVGEAPGAEEDRQGVPFVGRSGKLLDGAVALLGPALGSYGVLNLLKCRPPRNRFDTRAAAACRPYLDRQLELLRPRVLASLGARALRSLDPDAPPVLRSAGTVRRTRIGWLFPLIHPAAALRSRRLRERWDRDVHTFGDWLRSPSLEML